MTYTYFRTNPHSAGILIPEKSRTEFIQFCDKKGFFTLTPFIRAVFLPQNTLPGFIPVLYLAYYLLIISLMTLFHSPAVTLPPLLTAAYPRV